MALPPSYHQHCTDEDQKAETVLSAVSYISYIYIYHIYSICQNTGERKNLSPHHEESNPRPLVSEL